MRVFGRYVERNSADSEVARYVGFWPLRLADASCLDKKARLLVGFGNDLEFFIDEDLEQFFRGLCLHEASDGVVIEDTD